MPDWELDTPPQSGNAPAAGGPTDPSRRRRRGLPLRSAWVMVGVGALVVGALVGFYLARAQAKSEAAELVEVREELGRVEAALVQAEDRTWNYYQTVQALKAENEALRAGAGDGPGAGQGPTTTDRAPVGLGGSYDDGVYLVGDDIPPGTYDGVVTGEAGYWARLKGTDGMISSIITNAVARGPFVLTIMESDKAVELRGVTITAR